MKKQKKIGVLRYGIGNINSFTNTLDKLNYNNTKKSFKHKNGLRTCFIYKLAVNITYINVRRSLPSSGL